MTTLDLVPVGGSAVVATHGGFPRGSVTSHRLTHHGIVTGAELTVLGRTAGGGRLIGIGRSRVALTRAVTKGIQVEPGHRRPA